MMIERNLGKRNPILQSIIDNWFYILVVYFFYRFPYLVAEWSNVEVEGRAGESVIWQREMITIFSFMMLAISYNLMFGFTGLISFGHAVFFGMGAYTVAIVTAQFEMTFPEGVVAALGLSTILSLFWAVAAFRTKGVYFAVFTLAFAEIFALGVGLNALNEFTGGADGIDWRDGMPEWLDPVRERLTLYNAALICTVVTFIFVRRLMNSPTGKVLIAMRNNETRALTLGYNVYMYKMVSIIISGWIATIAGIIFALSPLNARRVNTGFLGLDRTVDPLLYTLIGGIGTMPGPVIGTLLLRVGEKFLRVPELRVDLRFIIGRITFTLDAEEYWPIMLGLTLILFTLFVPFGITGELNKTWIQLRQWIRRFMYNPLVYRYPQVATWARPLTGEPPTLAIAIAQQNPNPNLLEWLLRYPIVFMNSFTIAFAFTIGAITWEWRNGVEWFLFWIVVSIPFRLMILGYRFLKYFFRVRHQNEQLKKSPETVTVSTEVQPT